jgi:hypothetical protein
MGTYDGLIGTPVSGQPISVSQFGVPVRNAINDLDDRVSPLEVQSQRIVARGRRNTSTGNVTTTETGVLRIDNIPVIAGGSYRISTSNMNLDGSVDNDVGTARIRVATGAFGTTATIASTLIGYLRNTIDSAANSNVLNLQAFYFPSSDTYLSVLLSIIRQGGSGNIIIFGSASDLLDLTVEYSGADPGDTGVII